MIMEMHCEISTIVEIGGIIQFVTPSQEWIEQERGGCYQVQRVHHRDSRKDTQRKDPQEDI